MVSTTSKSGEMRVMTEEKERQLRPLRVVAASEVVPERVRYLWYPYIPAGKLTMLEGDPGMGKSWLTCAIATAASRGLPLPGQESLRHLHPNPVLFCSAEDGIGDTLVPRLQFMGADLAKIVFVTENFTLDGPGVARLEETMRRFAATIVFIDPIVAYVGGKMDMHRANEVRDVLKALSLAAERTGCAVVVVRHLRKAESKNALYRGVGSIDFTAAARSVLVVGYAKDGVTRLLRHIKCNVAPTGDAVAYEMVKGDCEMQEEDDGGFTAVVTNSGFNWLGKWWEDPEESAKKVSTTPKKRDEAQSFLIGLLNQGPLPALEIIALAKAAGISERTIKRAKQGLVESIQTDNIWLWRLVAAPPEGEQDGRAA